MSDLNGEKVLKIENPYWEFSTAGEGGRVIFRLRDKSRGRIYADGGYFCRIKLDEAAGKKTCAITYDSVSIDADEDAEVLTARGSLKVGPMPHVIELEQRYVLKRQSRWLEEYLTIKNDTDAGIVMKELQFALKKKLYDGSTGWVDGNDGYTLTSVPSRQYRSHRIDRKRDFIGAKDIVYTGWDTEVPGFCEEGWLWGNGEGGLLTCKYNQTEMEYARFESVVESIADLDFQAGPNRALCNTYLVFGGASTYKGEPGRALALEKGQSYAFGVSKYAVYDGDWQKGYRLYREHLEEMGHVTPEGFDPPIHWNELYNLGWFAEGRERYTKEQLMEEVGLARDVGAESFYMDPGWDIYPGSTIWDEKCFGPLGEFSKTIHEKYSLKLALHLMQSFLSDNEDELFYSLDQDGNRKKHWLLYDFCANGHWADEKGRRLNALADQWVDFFMVDFDEYGGSARDDGCHCPNHGHEVPLTRQSHAENILKVIQSVKRKHPEVLIEAHDRIEGGTTGYHAMYFQHNLPFSFDENWGFEYMWNPMLDLLSGRAVSLYGYNLACSIPLYLHINEGVDNVNMLEFWWYASVVRHIGIGGLTKADSQYDRLKRAVGLYKGLKPYFTAGRFEGIDPMSHLHLNEKEHQGVLTCYNLNGSEEKRIVRVSGGYGLSPDHVTASDGLGGSIDFEINRLGNGDFEIALEIQSLSPVIFVIG